MKLAARSRDKEDANVMLIIILLVFFFALCELFCKRDRKFELTAGEQGICRMQLIFHSVTPSSINTGCLQSKFFYLDAFPIYAHVCTEPSCS